MYQCHLGVGCSNLRVAQEANLLPPSLHQHDSQVLREHVELVRQRPGEGEAVELQQPIRPRVCATGRV